ncbi:hypothetical protein FS837_007114 [Tulasnella sp. UAMH 9824]|nr:hypothetical protein FS837_007114 [Tulasnella sp. UAMH 9824]
MSEPYNYGSNNSQKATHAALPPPKSTSSGNRNIVEKRFLAPGAAFGPLKAGDLRSPQDSPPRRINDLPTELIILILDAALDEVVTLPYYQGGYYLDRLKTLAAVCSTWRSTIQNTPSFWAHIESTITSDEMNYMLRKSGKRNLAFRYVMKADSGHDFRSLAGLDSPLDSSYFFELASSNMFRCSSLLAGVTSYRQLAHILESPAPVLRDATVIASDCRFNEPVSLFGGQAGGLETLWLSHINIQWDSGLPPKLRRFKVSYTNAPIAWLPHPRQVVSALSNCSGLEVVDLSGAIMVPGPLEWPGLGVQGPMVELPTLKELKIENMMIAGSAYIIQHLSTPPLQNLELTERLRIHSEPVALLLYPPSRLLLESIRGALPSCDKVILEIGYQHLVLEIEGVGGHVHLLLHCTDPDELTRWLAEEFASELSSVPELKLGVSSMLYESELQSLPKLIEALKSVVRLHCPLVQAAAGVLVEHLAWPYLAGDGWRWHWPRLKHLRLDEAYNWNELALTMLRERYGASQEENGGTSDGIPKWYPSPLTTLSLRGMDVLHPETYQEILNIVGEEVMEEDACVD